MKALLLADVIPRIPVCDPGGLVYFIQCLVAPDRSWNTDGRALVVAAMRIMVERHAAMVNVFSAPGSIHRVALRPHLSPVRSTSCKVSGDGPPPVSWALRSCPPS